MLMTEFTLDEHLLQKIATFTRRPLSSEEVYAFPVILCDNEVDRDCERFSLEALKTISEMFIGKTGIFDHDPKGENQTARIFDACVMEDTSRKTQAGEVYTAVVGKAYMVRTDDNRSLIAEIDAGIKKEVSISCSVAHKKCSVCGSNKAVSSCSHIRGKRYGEKLCHTVLCEPTDAYEWSFVAIPAQRNAGVTKGYSPDAVSKQPCDEHEESLREVTKRLFLLEPALPVSELRPLLSLLGEDRLKALSESLKRLSHKRKQANSPATTKELHRLNGYKL